MMSFRHAVASASVAGVATIAMPCAAQTAAPSPAQLEQLQQQIQALQQQLQSLQNQVNTSQKAQSTTAPAPAAPPGPRIVQSPTNRFSIESADGQYSIGLTGRLHLDTGAYINVSPDSPETTPSKLSSGFNARRARIGVAGKIAGDWTYTFIYDAGNSNDTTPRGIEFAQVNYRGFKDMAIDIGYSDTLFTIDEATNTNDMMFLERATPQVIATLFNTGDFRSNAGVRYFTDRFWLGAYATGPTQGQSHAQTAEQFGAFQRGTVQLFRGVDHSLHLGFGASQLLKAPNSGSGTARSITLSDTPELRIDPTPILNTGPLGSLAHPVSGGNVFNLETAASYKNFFWQGEYFHYSVDRSGLERASFNGGYGQASWTLTGEGRKHMPESGAYSSIVPDRPFSLKEGGWGAWELAARLSYVDLDDNFTRACRSPASRARWPAASRPASRPESIGTSTPTCASCSTTCMLTSTSTA